MTDKSLILKVVEVLDQHRKERRGRQTSMLSQGQVIASLPRWRWFLPTPGNVIFTLLVIGSLLWAQNAGAITLGAPFIAITSASGIPYQGRLADKNGAPLTQTVNMIFRLYAAASGGTPLWEEQWTGSNSVQVSDGLFNVMLGSLTPIPQSVITSNSNLFLGITVGTDSEMSPRVQLGSVPFAVQALTVPDGSITTAKLADRSISNGTSVSHDGSVVAGTTNSNTFTDMPGAGISVIITTTSANTILDTTLNASASSQGLNGVEFRLVLDGNRYGPDENGFKFFFNHSYVHHAFSWRWLFTNVTPGVHTIKVQWRSWYPTPPIVIDSSDDFVLSVVELKK